MLQRLFLPNIRPVAWPASYQRLLEIRQRQTTRLQLIVMAPNAIFVDQCMLSGSHRGRRRRLP